MTPHEVQAAIAAGAVVLDLRTPRPFAAEHLPGAVNLQFNRADLADRAEMVLPPEERYIVHAEPDAIAKIAVELLRGAGFQVQGYLEGGMRAWKAAALPTETLQTLDVDEMKLQAGALRPLDVREPFEYRHAHVAGALSLPWTGAWSGAGALQRGVEFAVLCGDEVRSAAAASILKRGGHAVRLVLGGMADWLERGYPVEKGAPAPVSVPASP